MIDEKEVSLKEQLTDWIYVNRLQAKEISDKLFEIKGVGTFLLIEPKEMAFTVGFGNVDVTQTVILDRDFDLTLELDEEESKKDFYVFKFGDNFYYSATKHIERLTIFKFLGEADVNFEQVPFLGLHGPYELCNGSRDYVDWIAKAKFFGIKTLGLCELNTLGGTMAFQNACDKAKMKSVIGESFGLKLDDDIVSLKLYAKNADGFHKLLRINNIISTREDKTLELNEIKKEFTENMVAVICADANLTEVRLTKLKKSFNELYFQIDFVEWQANDRDKGWLEAMQKYVTKFRSQLAPIFIQDAYYLDKADENIKKILNKIGGVGFKAQSKDQFFKSVDDVLEQAVNLFTEEGENLLMELVEESCQNLNKVAEECNFRISVGNNFLPEYELTDEDIDTYNVQTSEDLFYALIERGFKEKIAGKVEDENVYLDRIEEEIKVITGAESGISMADYFLILWDVIRMCKREGIWVGLGRGSAAGSLISYCLGIVGIDPIKYDLLFSRFLSAARLPKKIKQEYIVIETNDGPIEFKSTDKVTVIRDKKEVEIEASELIEGDNLK